MIAQFSCVAATIMSCVRLFLGQYQLSVVVNGGQQRGRVRIAGAFVRAIAKAISAISFTSRPQMDLLIASLEAKETVDVRPAHAEFGAMSVTDALW